MGAMPVLISAAQELFYAGIDPNEMRFKRVGNAVISVFSAAVGGTLLWKSK